MNRIQLSIVVAVVLMLALAAPASAHNMEVNPPGQADGTEVWIGGFFVLGKGEGLFPGPFPNTVLPASHREGLPHACNATMSNPSAVTILAPPFGVPGDDPCQHNVQAP